MCGNKLTQDKKALVAKVQAAKITPKGFHSEEAMLDNIVTMVRTCPKKRTLMLTGNYVVRDGPNVGPGDPRLLGHEILLTIELCARAYKRCVEAKVEPPTILLVPNDIVPETFESFEEERAFKKEYEVPAEIRVLLAAAGMIQEPLYFFNRNFEKTGHDTASELALMRKRIAQGSEKLVVVFESFAQNLAAKALKKGTVKHAEDMQSESSGRRRAIIPTSIIDTFSMQPRVCLYGTESWLELGDKPRLSSTGVPITNPNGAPSCSFLAATLFREFEDLGFELMTNTFVKEEYPCVDKAAAAYRHFHEGRMPIRNIYMDGAGVVVDNTIR